MDYLNNKYVECFKNDNNHLTINSLPILVEQKDCELKYKNKVIRIYDEMFLHLCTNELNQDFSTPCKNIYPYNLCGKKEYTCYIKNKIREVCLYRADRITWIPKIINLINLNDSSVKIYKEKKKIYCLYTQNSKRRSTHYLIIFKEGPECYYFVTAYPLTAGKFLKNLQSYKEIYFNNEKTESTYVNSANSASSETEDGFTSRANE